MYTNFIQFSSQITIGLEEFIKSSNECHSVKILYYLQNLQPCSGISVQEPLQEVHLFTLYLKFVRGALFSTESSDSSCFSFCRRLCHVVSNSRCDDVDECDLETEYGFDSVVWGGLGGLGGLVERREPIVGKSQHCRRADARASSSSAPSSSEGGSLDLLHAQAAH